MYKLLQGLRVVEGAAFIAGPSCTMHMAQMGAEVIRFDNIGGRAMARISTRPGCKFLEEVPIANTPLRQEWLSASEYPLAGTSSPKTTYTLFNIIIVGEWSRRIPHVYQADFVRIPPKTTRIPQDPTRIPHRIPRQQHC